MGEHKNREVVANETAGQTPKASNSTVEEGNPTFIDVFLILVRFRRVIAASVVFFTVLGLLYAVLATPVFTAKGKFVRETSSGQMQLSGGLASLQGLGVGLGNLGDGLSPEAFPEILHSREVRMSVVRDTFYFPDMGRRATFLEHVKAQETGVLGFVRRWTVRLPGRLVETVKESGSSNQQGESVDRKLTFDENMAMEMLITKVQSSVDQESGLMTVQVTAEDPVLAADITNSVIEHLSEKVREIRTRKTKQSLEFIRQRFTETGEELRQAEERLADFVDRNKNLSSAELKTERDRLQRQVQFKSQLYSNLQSQLTKTEIELKRNEPAVTMVGEPSPPTERSAPQRTLTVLMTIFVGLFVGGVLAFVLQFLHNREQEGEGEKLEHIRKALLPKWMRARLPSLDEFTTPVNAGQAETVQADGAESRASE